jgi:hypothetical protein
VDAVHDPAGLKGDLAVFVEREHSKFPSDRSSLRVDGERVGNTSQAPGETGRRLEVGAGGAHGKRRRSCGEDALAAEAAVF